MPFFPKMKVCFIHIPKTGGTSVENYFSNIENKPLGLNTLYYRHTNDLAQAIDKKRREWNVRLNNFINKEIVQLRLTASYNRDSRKKLQMIQNNMAKYTRSIQERMVDNSELKKLMLIKHKGYSLHHFTWNDIRTQKNILFGEKIAKLVDEKNNDMTFIASVRNPYDRIISELFFLKKINKTFNQKSVFQVIKQFLNDKNHYDNHKTPQYKFVINEKGELIQNLKIVRTESLDSDMEKLGYKSFTNARCKNVNTKYNKSKYSNLLNRESIELINNYYAKDFEYFNYSKL
jgi:hypothetical protein